jgi:hypothetical protein
MSERESLCAFLELPGNPQFVTRDCPYCDGIGRFGWEGCSRSSDCEECDGTGHKYRAIWTTDDGIVCSMTGSGNQPPDANTRAVMEIVARAALDATDRTEGGDEAHRAREAGESAATRGADAVRASDPPTSDRAYVQESAEPEPYRVASDPEVRHDEHDGGDGTGNVPNAGRIQ